MNDRIQVTLGTVAGLGITLEATGFEQAFRRPTLDNLDLLTTISKVVKKYAQMAQKQAVVNVSGGQVMYSGGVFVIHRQTGKLARSIQVSYPSPLSAVVMASAEYAAALEGGVPYPVDLKPSLMGKTVFIPFKNAQDPKAPRDSAGNYMGVSLPKYDSKGNRAGNRFGIFRRVTPNSTGWIIPPRPPRPFMRAAAEAVMPGYQKELTEAFRAAIEGKK